jgi:transketolase
MRNAFIRGLTALAERDDRVVLLTGDLGYKIFDNFAEKFPGRFINAGVAEQNMVGVATGLALEGFRPFVYSIATFATLRCFEQIRDDVCYNDVPVTIVGVGGGFSYGANGPTHHATEDIAIMRALPNMTVVCPGDPVEAELAVVAAASHEAPLYLRLGRAGDPVVHHDQPNLRIGESIEVLKGNEVSLISTGGMLPVATAAADLLEAANVSCRVISMHTVKPLDMAVLEACCNETKALFTLEEHSRIGGLGSAVGEWMSDSGRSCKLTCFGTEDRFADTAGSQAYLRQQQGLSAEQIAQTVMERLGE